MNTKLNEIITNNNENIYLYGASSSGLRLFNNLVFLNVDINRLFFIDSNPLKQGKFHGDRPILTNIEFNNLDKNSQIIISSCMHYEIEPFLKSNGFKKFFYFKDLIYTGRIYEKFNKEFIKILAKIKEIANLDFDELYTIYSSLKATFEIRGDIAEVGTYRGGSAFLLGNLSNNKNLYLFDTFEGIPEGLNNSIKNEPKIGWLSNTSEDKVKKFVLQSGIDSKKLHLIKGFFPKSAEGVLDHQNIYSLIHLDTDMFESTYSALNYFYPRLSKGGRIIIHDFNCCGCPGVKKAVIKFMKEIDKSEMIIEISESQALICKY